MNKGVSALFLVLVVAAAMVQSAAAVDCVPTELSPCLRAISGAGDPTPECCSKLKEQQPCFCGYLKNPQLKPYINSPNARKVAGFCGIAVPTCS